MPVGLFRHRYLAHDPQHQTFADREGNLPQLQIRGPEVVLADGAIGVGRNSISIGLNSQSTGLNSVCVGQGITNSQAGTVKVGSNSVDLGLFTTTGLIAPSQDNNVSTGATLTAAQMSPNAIVDVSAGGVGNVTIASGAVLDAAFSTLAANNGWVWYLANNSGGAITLLGGVGNTLDADSSLAVADGDGIGVITRRTGIATYTTRVVTFNAGGGGSTAVVVAGAGANSMRFTTGTAAGSAAVSLGHNGAATMANDIAIGTGAGANAGGAIAIGPAAAATGASNIVIGASAQCSGASSVVLGHLSNCGTGAGVVALGPAADATAAAAIAIGRNAQATAIESIAIGGDSGAVDADAANATGLRSLCIGTNSLASAQEAVAVGPGAEASGAQSTAVGFGATASAASACAFGSAAQATQSSALALGSGVSVTAIGAVGLGSSNSIASTCILGANGSPFERLEAQAFVTQGTSNDTAVGVTSSQFKIEMNAAIVSNTAHTFVINNGRVTAGCGVQLSMSGASSSAIPTVCSAGTIGAGSFAVNVWNPDTGSNTTAAPVLHCRIDHGA